jgi:hypothetical protein
MSLNLARKGREASNQPAAGERREAIRYLWRRPCIVRPEGAPGIGSWSGMVYDLSSTGVGVALTYPVPVGKILVIEPLGNFPLRTMQAGVVRCVQKEFVWFHGCQFAQPLTEEELMSWLR